MAETTDGWESRWLGKQMAGTAHVAKTTDGWESRWLGQYTWLRQLTARKADGWESRYIRRSIKLLGKAKLEFIILLYLRL